MSLAQGRPARPAGLVNPGPLRATGARPDQARPPSSRSSRHASRSFRGLSGIRLLGECRAVGYTGGVTPLRDYLRQRRPEPEPEIRFETEPGHQAQVDFAYCRLPWGVRYALVVVLGHSRLLWVQFYPPQDLRTLLHGLEACFTTWGSVPRELLFDQMRSVITRDERLTGGELVHNLELSRFARHYGFRVRVCKPYWAKTKGKGERPIRYLRDNLLYGRHFLSDADLNAQKLTWAGDRRQCARARDDEVDPRRALRRGRAADAAAAPGAPVSLAGPAGRASASAAES